MVPCAHLRPRVPRLVLEGGLGAPIPLREQLTLGRDPRNALVLSMPQVSTCHAVIRHTEGRWVVEDLQSTNGTWLNGQRVRGPEPLRDGDLLHVGPIGFRVEGMGA